MFASPSREIVLARGLIDDDGQRHRHIVLRSLTGWEESQLSQIHIDAHAVHLLLADCVLQIGDFHEVTPALTAALTRSDRAQIGLELRAMIFGDNLSLSVQCKNPSCGEWADFRFNIPDLIGDVSQPQHEWLEVDTEMGVARIRAPIGEDDEICQSLGDDRQRSSLLWSRLINRLGKKEGIGVEDWSSLSPAVQQSLALGLNQLLEYPELSFVSRCPQCQAGLELTIEPFELLARELRQGGQRLLAEVHSLAYHYGWDEDQILSLPRQRRWAYLDLLTRQVEGRPLILY